jgi:hypothetical protein
MDLETPQIGHPELSRYVTEAVEWLIRLQLADLTQDRLAIPMEQELAEFESWRISSPLAGRALALANQGLPPP